MMPSPFETMAHQYPNLAIALLIVYSVALTIFTVYKLVYSIYFDAKKDYLTKLSTYCENISDLVARIATADAYPTALINEFWIYYYGKLILVEDRPLEAAMVRYGDLLEETNAQNFTQQQGKLERATLAVSGACRDLIKKTWKLSIRPWKDFQGRATQN